MAHGWAPCCRPARPCRWRLSPGRCRPLDRMSLSKMPMRQRRAHGSCGGSLFSQHAIDHHLRYKNPDDQMIPERKVEIIILT